jgi:hypothetical protein
MRDPQTGPVVRVVVVLAPDRDEPLDALLGGDVVLLEPARVSYRAFGRLPAALAEALAAGQARRLKLPGTPRVVVMLEPLQWPLARGVLAHDLEEQAVLWYVRPGEPTTPRAAEYDAEATERAVAVLDSVDELAQRLRGLGL